MTNILSSGTMYLEYLDAIKSKLESCDFYRIFIENTKSESVIAKEGKIDSIGTNESFGLSIFYTKNKFGYFYSTNNPENLKNFKIDLALKKYSNLDYKPRESFIKDSKVIGDKSNIDLENIAKELADITKLKEKIISHGAEYTSWEQEKNIICSNTNIYQKNYFGKLYNSAIAKDGDIIRSDLYRTCKGNSLNNYVKPFLDRNEKFEEKIIDKLKLKEGLTGKLNVILDPSISSLLAHEAIGHSCEGDLIYNKQSVLKNKFGKTLASDFLNLEDNPSPKLDLFGSFYYDDEGFKAKQRLLIKDGKLNDYILNDKYSQLLKMENNAGSRTIGYQYLPIPRMSNTNFLPGDKSLNEIMQEMKNGVILSGFSGGETDPTTGTYQFGIKEAHIVKNSEIRDTKLNISFSGDIMNSLKNINSVTKETKCDGAGFCGKEDQSGLPCDSVDPYLFIKNVRFS